ncbi:MAG: hypothetical protein CSA42_03405 [Gammaproteobacteria bacterium]|nr:MAG: hypothetical protein CSA42_03405 [Gammaproteobacteria bacterium]
MNTPEIEKYNAYKKLMRRKRLLLLSSVIFMLIFTFILNVLRLPGFILMGSLAIYLYISMFIFLAKNVCPWCKLPFFLFGPRGLSGDGIHFFFQKKCINCGRPFYEVSR